jgi:hypothetical protein
MRRKSIRDRYNHIDAESYGKEIVAKRLSVMDAEQIARDRIDALQLEEEATETVEVLSDLKEVAEEIQEVVDDTLENIETMTDVEIGMAVKEVETLVEELGEDTEELVDGVDAEAMRQDAKAVAKILLDSYRTKADNALAGTADAEGFLDIFKSAETKFKETTIKSKQWVSNNDAKIGDLNATIAEKANEKKDGVDAKSVASKLGNRLATVRAAGASLDDLTKFAGALTVIPESASGLTAIDGEVLTFIKKFDKGIKAEDFVKAVRVDGKSLSYVVLSKVDGQVGFREYKSISIPGAALTTAAGKVTDAEITVDYAKKLIATAKTLSDAINGATTTLAKEIETIKGMLSKDIEQAKWDKGPMFKMGGWNWFFVILGGVIGIAGSLAEAARDGKKSFEELSAKDKERVLRARAELTARYANDAIFGLNNLVNELLESASIILSNLKDKE